MSRPFALSAEVQEKLARLAAQSGKSWELVLEESLAEYQLSIEAKAALQARSASEALQKAGLLGCLSDAPPDLSTNPAYLEGFGSSAT